MRANKLEYCETQSFKAHKFWHQVVLEFCYMAQVSNNLDSGLLHLFYFCNQFRDIKWLKMTIVLERYQILKDWVLKQSYFRNLLAIQKYPNTSENIIISYQKYVTPTSTHKIMRRGHNSELFDKRDRRKKMCLDSIFIFRHSSL